MNAPIRAIYVDDDPKMASLLPRALTLADIDVLAVYESAEDLLAMGDTAIYREAEIFVIDVRLPRMTGIELAKRMRAEGEERPIIAVSAWSEEASWRLEEIGIEYLQKPYEFEELEQKIKELVER